MVKRTELPPEQLAEIRAKDRALKAAIPIEDKRAYNAEWRATVSDEWKERKRAYNRERYRRQAEAFSVRSKAWREANLEHCRNRGKAYYEANKEAYIAKQIPRSDRRRALLLSAPTYRVSAADWRAIVQRFEGRCAYCGVQAAKLNKEHVIPLVRGGSHSIGNLVPACEPCNKSKGKKTVMEWRMHRLRYQVAA